MQLRTYWMISKKPLDLLVSWFFSHFFGDFLANISIFKARNNVLIDVFIKFLSFLLWIHPVISRQNVFKCENYLLNTFSLFFAFRNHNVAWTKFFFCFSFNSVGDVLYNSVQADRIIYQNVYFNCQNSITPS